MQKALILKSLVVFFLTVLLAVPLLMIESTIAERSSYKRAAADSVAADSVGQQSIVGPVLVVPYLDQWEVDVEVEVDEKLKTKKIERRKKQEQRLHYVFPNDLQLTGKVETDARYRGIHKVLVYGGTHTIKGDFQLPNVNEFARAKQDSIVTLGTPYVSLGLRDTRGLKNFPKIVWGNKEYEFRQESRLRRVHKGIHAPLPNMPFTSPMRIDFSMELMVDGIENLRFIPLAKNNQYSLRSNWQHPQFGGRFLPAIKGREIGANGFAANWNISSLASNAQQQFVMLEQREEDRGEAGLMELDNFSVDFIEPVNIYSLSMRAVKYGLLFVGLTFAAFFLFEVLKQLPIHPVQYTLVGMALALFFLLLVSLSEHMDFFTAYLLAGGACILLIGFYLAHALRSKMRGFGFGLALVLVYGALLVLLQSEKNALVLGSGLLFAVVAAIMVVTRKVDWYQLGKSAPAPVAAVVAE